MAGYSLGSYNLSHSSFPLYRIRRSHANGFPRNGFSAFDPFTRRKPSKIFHWSRFNTSLLFSSLPYPIPCPIASPHIAKSNMLVMTRKQTELKLERIRNLLLETLSIPFFSFLFLFLFFFFSFLFFSFSKLTTVTLNIGSSCSDI